MNERGRVLNIEITAASADLACSIAAKFEAAGHTIARIGVGGKQCGIRYRSGLEVLELAGILENLRPFSIANSTTADLDDGVDISIELGTPEPLTKWNVSLYVDSESFGAEMRARLENAGFRVAAVHYGYREDNHVDYGGASDYARRYLGWLLGASGLRVTENKEWDESDDDLWVMLRDPQHEGKQPREYLEVVVRTDDQDAAAPLVDQLKRAGYRVSMEYRAEPRRVFELQPGPFGQAENDAAELQGFTVRFLESLAVDATRFPLKGTRTTRHMPPAHLSRRLPARDALRARIDLPVKAWREGALMAYAGAFPERFPVEVRTDDPSRAEPFLRELREAGFACTIRKDDGIRCPSLQLSGDPGETEVISGTITRLLRQSGVAATWPEGMLVPVQGTTDRCAVTVSLPFSRCSQAAVDAAVATLSGRADVTVHYSGSSDCSTVVERLRPFGFKTIRAASVPMVSTFRIRYGGADPAVIASVSRAVQELVKTAPATTKDWDDSDLDVFVDVPPAIASALPLIAGPTTIAPPLPSSGKPRSRFLRKEKTSIRIGDVRLPLKHPDEASLVPTPAEFEGYCLDQPTADTLRHLALSVLLCEPCLLEGPTGTSKTSSIRYLAWQLNQPVVRINFNGQTDTGELVGRFVPSSGEGSTSPWTWQDGLLVQAMRRGWWVILDEVNLAEPQVLERLNSVLEETPSLTLTEFDNSVVGPSGTPIHPDFRLFATMNPADYAGRSVLSPAWRDRWRATRTVPGATEAEYEALLRQSILGRGPSVAVGGKAYRRVRTAAPYSSLRRLADVELAIEGLARFHVAVERAAAGAQGSSTHVGAGRKEPYVFTRRTVLSVLRYLEHLVASGSTGSARDLLQTAVSRYYLARCSTVDDRNAVEQLLEASLNEPARYRLHVDEEIEDLLANIEVAE